LRRSAELALVKTLVGTRERGVEARARQPLADTHRPADGVFGAAQALEHRASEIGAGQQQRELVAAVAREDVTGSRALPPLASECDEQLVTGGAPSGR
jgi:hypothetical protein